MSNGQESCHPTSKSKVPMDFFFGPSQTEVGGLYAPLSLFYNPPLASLGL